MQEEDIKHLLCVDTKINLFDRIPKLEYHKLSLAKKMKLKKNLANSLADYLLYDIGHLSDMYRCEFEEDTETEEEWLEEEDDECTICC